MSKEQCKPKCVPASSETKPFFSGLHAAWFARSILGVGPSDIAPKPFPNLFPFTFPNRELTLRCASCYIQ